MNDTTRPKLTIYRAPGCHLCDDAEVLLRDELSERARSGLPPVTVERVDITGDPELERRYRRRIPVFAMGDLERELVISAQQIREFFQRAGPA